jgi:hypothetical protein
METTEVHKIENDKSGKPDLSKAELLARQMKRLDRSYHDWLGTIRGLLNK